MKKNHIFTRGLHGLTAMALGVFLSTTSVTFAAEMSNGADNFYKSDKVTMQKDAFRNQYNMNVVGNLFIPKGLKQNTKNPAIIVGHPMGAVKEQSANLYATKMLNRDSLLCLWIYLSGERVRVSLATPFHRISMPRISVLRWISWAPGRLLTGIGLVLSGFVAAGALSSAQPRSTRA